MIQSSFASPAKSKLHGLDHLRALAITLVFLYHYGRLFPHPEWVNTVSKFGWTGVDLFFVLSGYLIASQLFATPEATKKAFIKTFYVKRFFRIIPAYLAVVGLYFFFPYIHEREALAPLWKYLTFTQNLGLDLRSQGTFSHAWSLCIEEQFYLFLPLLLAAFVRFRALQKGAWLLVALALSGFVIRSYAYQHFAAPYSDDDVFGIFWLKAIYYPTWCRLDGLLAGVGLAALCQYRPAFAQRFLKHGNVLAAAGLVVLTAAYFLCLEETSFAASVAGFPLVALGYGLLVAGAVGPTGFLYSLKSTLAATVATLSYAVYLTHKFVIHVTQELCNQWGADKDSNGMFLLCTTATLSVSLFLNKAIEKPFLQLRQRLLRKGTKPAFQSR